MAGDAAIALEQLIAALRIAGDRVPLAAQIAVERRVGRQEGAFEGCDRVEHPRPIGACAIGRRERLTIAWVAVELGEQFGPGGVHQARVEQDRVGLLNGRFWPSKPGERARLSSPPSSRWWHAAQAIVSLCESLGSKNSRSPRRA